MPEDDGSNCGQEQYHGWFCNYEPNLFGQDHACVYYDEEESFPFADRSSFVIATCYEYPFAEPTNENCLCFVVLSESFENFGLNEICTVCSFLAGGDENDGNWDISYDCSNLISGDCVGRTEEGECIVNNATDPVFDLPEHSCLNASEIESQNLPYTTTGEFGLSSYLLEFDIDAFQCSGVGPFVYIQWFSVIGRESCLRVTSENSDVDTKLAVFKGECRSLACYRQDDDYGMTLQSRVEWYGNDGEEYHVLLSSYDLFQFGTWVLNVEEFDCDLDKACASSIEIDELPYLDSGSSANGPVQFAGSQALTCPVVKPDIRGVWYAGQAISESCITVSTAGSQFDTVLAVYTGSCDNLSCLVENDNESELVRSSQVSWTAEPETLYYLFLGGVDLDAAGDFQISVTVCQKGIEGKLGVDKNMTKSHSCALCLLLLLFR